MTEDILSLVKRKEWTKIVSKCKTVSPCEMLKRDPSRFNETILHIALTLKPPVEVIKCLLHFADGSQAVRLTEDCNGYLPLHTAIRYKSSLEVISLLIDAYKEGVSVKDKNQWSSIHLASYFNSDPSVVDLLLKTDPSLARMKTKQKSTALHIACRRKANAGIIQSLLNLYPEAAQNTLQGSWSPLHLAIWHEAPEEVIIALVTACPEATTQKTSSSGQSPLSLYWTNKVRSPNVISILLDPPISSTEESQGSNQGLIHKVLKFPQKIPNLLTYVLDEFKDDSQKWDNEGRLPLHVAIERRKFVGERVWKKIFKRYPNAILQSERKTSFYPFMIASVGSDLSLTYELIRLAPHVFEHMGMT